MKVVDEEKMVGMMIALYCKKKHKCKSSLCEECLELENYVKSRLGKCPFKDKKTFCSNCKIHCYNPAMREKIKNVMRFSGARMLFYHPKVAILHMTETFASNKKAKRQEKSSDNKNGQK